VSVALWLVYFSRQLTTLIVTEKPKVSHCRTSALLQTRIPKVTVSIVSRDVSIPYTLLVVF